MECIYNEETLGNQEIYWSVTPVDSTKCEKFACLPLYTNTENQTSVSKFYAYIYVNKTNVYLIVWSVCILNDH